LKNDQLADLNRGQEQLAEQLDSTYRLARQSRIKLILNQDSPAELSRLLGYHERINAVQVQKIQRLRKLLDELNKTVAAISIELSAVEQAQKEQQSIRNEQAEQVLQREALIASLSTQISGEESRLKELRQNQEDLEKLLQRLTDVLADIPANLGRQLGVSEQKGHLPMPAKGPVKHGFGQSRSGTMSWQGWVIDVSRGTEVAAVAYGRVAFADWLRGYGLLMIIDHGDGFMTLYGYNESLLWDVGDWVEPSAVIATAGNSPGGEYGLYFELRKEGRALDPAAWIKR